MYDERRHKMTQHKTTFKRSVAILMTLAMVLSLPTGITMPRQAQAAGYGLNNPTTDSKGVTTWDCVYFGNYWQGATPRECPKVCVNLQTDVR